MRTSSLSWTRQIFRPWQERCRQRSIYRPATLARTVASAAVLVQTASAQTPPALAWQQAGHTGRVERVGYSPNGLWMATAAQDGRLNLYSAKDNCLKFRFWSTAFGPLAFSNDSAQLAFLGTYDTSGRGVQFLNLSSGLIIPIRIATTDNEDVAVYRSSNGTRYAYTASTNSVTKWVLNGSQYQAEWTWSNISYGSHRLSLSPDGSKLAVSANPCKVFDTATHAELTSLANGLSVRFSPNGQYLAVGCTASAKNAKLYQVSNWSLLRTLTTNEYVYAVGWTADSQNVLCTRNSRVRKHRVSDGGLVWESGSLLNDNWDLSVSPTTGTTLLASGYGFGVLCSADAALSALPGSTAAIGGIAYSPIGSFLATATDDPGTHLWNPWVGTLVRNMYHTNGGFSYVTRNVAFTGDGKKLVTTDNALNGTVGNIRVFDALTSTQLNTQVMYQTSTPAAIAVSKKVIGTNGYLLATADGLNVRIWSLSTYLGLRILTDAEATVCGLRFSPNGTYLAVATTDGKVRLYKTANWTPPSPLLTGSSGYGVDLDFSLDETLLFVQNDKSVYKFAKGVGDTWSNSLSTTLDAGALSIGWPRISVSGDGRSVFSTFGTKAFLLSAANLSIVRQWMPFEGASDVTDSEVSPDSTALAVSDWTGTVRVFQNVNGPILSGLTATPGNVKGGVTTQGQVTISRAAPAGGVRVYLSDNTSAMSCPSTVTVPAGQTSVTFTISTKPVSQSVTRELVATCAGASVSANVTITP